MCVGWIFVYTGISYHVMANMQAEELIMSLILTGCAVVLSLYHN